MRLLVAALFIALPAFVGAKEPKTLNEAMSTLAKDLSSLQRNVDALGKKQWAYMPSKLRIVRPHTSVYRGADAKSGVLTRLPEGQTARIVDKAGEWYAIGLEQEVKGQNTGWVSASSAAPEMIAFGPSPINKDDLYEAIMEQVSAFKEMYSTNPYIKITGFSVDISLSPGVSVDFEFK